MKLEEENKSEKESNKKEVVVPAADNNDLVKELLEEVRKLKEKSAESDTILAIKELVAGLKERPDSEKYGGEDTYTRPEDIDPEDRLEVGVTFFSHQVAYIIADDKRNGHNVRTPFGKAIKFVYQATRQVKSGNETRLHNLSSYTSYSKKEVEWIMDHKFYGTIFFSSHTEALGADAKKASKLARIIVTLQRYDVHKIVTMAKGLGIPPSDNIPALRIAIANKQAEDEIRAEEASSAIRLKESIIEKDLLKTPTT